VLAFMAIKAAQEKIIKSIKTNDLLAEDKS
jgi:hypothetical protein